MTTATYEFPRGQAATQRNRPSWEDKKAAVAGLLRLADDNGTVSYWFVHACAQRFGVTTRAVQNWLGDRRLRDADANQPRREGSYTLDDSHLVVLAQEGNARGAYDRLRTAGEISCGYSTFARALQRANPAKVQGALKGGPGLVNNRVYLSNRAPHRNYAWHIDHTELDLRVLPNHRYRKAIRPHVTAIVDNATGYTLALIPWHTNPGQESVAAALVAAAVPRIDNGVTVGGSPSQIVCDNAAEHFGSVVLECVERLGWYISPTGPYSSFQNGKAERTLGLVNQMFAKRMPGATNAGATRTGQPRHTTSDPAKVDPDQTLSWNAFTHLLESFRQKLNREVRSSSRGGQTRLEAWAADNTELRLIDAATLHASMLRTTKEFYTCSKSGLQFRNKHYVCTGLSCGARYEIRYLESIPEFVEVYDEFGNYVSRAYENLDVPADVQEAIVAERARQEKTVAAVEDGVQQYRRQYAAAANEMLGDEPLTWDPIAAAVDDGRFVDWIASMEDGDTTTPPASARPKLPRTNPRRANTGSASNDAARGKANERLEQVLRQQRASATSRSDAPKAAQS